MKDIDWSFPAPRAGSVGLLDRFVGPGATRAELWLQFSLAAVAIIGALAYALWQGVNWSVLQFAMAGFLAFDVVGGIVTNATSSAKRWYHRHGQSRRDHMVFVAVHIAHLSLVAWMFVDGQWSWAAVAALYLFVASALILGVPKYLQRPVALGTFAGAIVLCDVVLARPAGLEWFAPLFYLKLLVSHLPTEEPYRPGGDGWPRRYWHTSSPGEG
ncbi:MAG: hypothetical protein AAFX85_02495 [Pseudomonadota bacterium]